MRTVFKENLDNIDIFRLSNKAKTNPEIAKYCDWEKLIAWLTKNTPETSISLLGKAFRPQWRDAFRVACEEIAAREAEANTVIKIATAAAAAAGASPIPFSDAAILIPIQTGMILKIASIYHVHLGKAVVWSVVQAVLASAIGRSVVTNLLKFIPGVGSVIGGGISAVVASGITYALGTAFLKLCQSGDGKAINSDSFMAEVLKKAKESKK